MNTFLKDCKLAGWGMALVLWAAAPCFAQRPPTVHPCGAGNCSQTSIGQTPINDLGTGAYQGYQGGLYSGGVNVDPAAHLASGTTIAHSIQPLDTSGNPDPGGLIGWATIGMSATEYISQSLVSFAKVDAGRNPAVKVVTLAQGGATAPRLLDPQSSYWLEMFTTLLPQNGLTPQQVEVVWMMDVDQKATLPFPQDQYELQNDLSSVAEILLQKFPNLKLLYVSSYTYTGYATNNNLAEPESYNGAFAVKWMIEDQISGNMALNFDSTKGPVKAPWMAWAYYFWADGLVPRSDGITWACSQYADDGIHPCNNPGGGADDMGKLLLTFFQTDSTSIIWYCKTSGVACPSSH
jgi:hypothetical protein